MSVEISYKKQGLLFFIFVIIILGVVEIGARVYESQKLSCNFIGKDAFNQVDEVLQNQVCNDTRDIAYTEPDILRFVPNQNYETININSHGFRGGEISDKQNEVFRIILVGGSTTFGAGATSDDNTIPGQLQELFNKKQYNVEVINAGINSGYSYTEKILIEKDLISLEPNLLILYTGGNDSHRPIIYPTAKVGDIGINFKDVRFWRTPFVISDIIIDTTRYEKTNLEIDKNFVSEKISFWKKNMNDICMIANEKNIMTVVTIHPILATSEKIFSDDEHSFMNNDDFQTTRTVLEIHEGISGELKELDSICDNTYDLRKSFKGISEPIFFDEVHVNDKGNGIIANKLFEIIEPYI